MRTLLAILVLAAACPAQLVSNAPSSTISVSGDAAVKVAPDRVTLDLAVETRNKDLAIATSQNDALVRQVISAARKIPIEAGDIQTDYIHVDLAYNDKNSTVVEYYSVTKALRILLKDVSKFETLLHAVLGAGANHIYGIEFSTSELRKYRDQARALAVKAAIEKANDLAAAAGLKVVGKPQALTTYSYGGGSSYGFCCSRYGGSQFQQNVVQNAGAGGDIGSEGTVALGKINVSASVTLTFQTQ
jgi:uncharacterized protein YggE